MRLKQIATAEHVDVTPEVVSTLIDTSNGDLRRAITYLQSASRLSSSSDPPSVITPNDIQETAGVVPTTVVNDFAKILGLDIAGDMDIDGVVPKRQGFHDIQKKVKEVIRQGYSAMQLLLQVGGVNWANGSCYNQIFSSMTS